MKDKDDILFSQATSGSTMIGGITPENSYMKIIAIVGGSLLGLGAILGTIYYLKVKK